MPKKTFDKLPLLDGELFDKLKNRKGEVLAKLDNIFAWKSGDGLSLNMSVNGKKFTFLVNYSRYDLRSLLSQMEGQEFKFVAREGNQGRVFINAYNPYSKK